jgi:hypothetical protein
VVGRALTAEQRPAVFAHEAFVHLQASVVRRIRIGPGTLVVVNAEELMQMRRMVEEPPCTPQPLVQQVVEPPQVAVAVVPSVAEGGSRARHRHHVLPAPDGLAGMADVVQQDDGLGLLWRSRNRLSGPGCQRAGAQQHHTTTSEDNLFRQVISFQGTMPRRSEHLCLVSDWKQ